LALSYAKQKIKTTVEYALRESRKPIGVASYTIIKNLPKELKHQLPCLEQIEKLMGEIE
jgi:hypothetical protein